MRSLKGETEEKKLTSNNPEVATKSVFYLVPSRLRPTHELPLVHLIQCTWSIRYFRIIAKKIQKNKIVKITCGYYR